MKSLILILTISFTFSFSFSQDKEICIENLSIFAESAKVKNYDEAYKPWSEVKDQCPDLNLAIYTYGERILKSKIKNAQPEDIDNFKNQLIELYDQWLIHFPSKRGISVVGDILSSKAQSMIDYQVGSPSDVYEVFDKAFLTDSKSFTNPKRLYNYFKTLYNIYKESGNVSTEKLFEKYEEVSEKFELESKNLAKKLDVIIKKEQSGEVLNTKDLKRKRVYDVNSNAISVFLSNLDAIISKESSCDNLIPLYQRNFEQNKGDIVWLNRAASRMDAKECSDDPLFVKLVEQLHSLEPSANSAYYLGLLNDKQGNSSQALKYYEESIQLETDPYKKAKILYKIALKFKTTGRKSTSRNYAFQALKHQPSLGKAYLLIANLYASSANDCGNSQFEKRSVYWLAAETARKASRVDASVKKLAIKTAQSYEGRAPSKTDIFTEGNEGKLIQFSCWISRSVKVPTL